MKNRRQEVIRELLREQAIQTQEDLVTALRARDFKVTQATVSRDMREMHLIKVPGKDGSYRYAEPDATWAGVSDRMIRMLRDCVLSAEVAGQMIVVKTMSGSANAAAEALDTVEMPEIVGSIAGDNTIFLAARDHAGAAAAVERIHSLLSQ